MDAPAGHFQGKTKCTKKMDHPVTDRKMKTSQLFVV